jgi:lipid II:glycine glycyltransferase (peptidoglycan interpeptide bridge formation enzyme)
VIKEDGEVIALAQIILLGVPLLGRILAYVIFGPVWQRHGSARRIESLAKAIAALRDEYAVRRRLCLRLRWWGYDIPDNIRTNILAEGIWKETRPLHNTCILDLSQTENQLRAAMDKKWRANLRKAEQQDLVVSRQNDSEGISIFVELYRQMHERKRFNYDDSCFWADHCLDFSNECRPEVFICRQRDVPVAGGIVSAMGDRAFYLHGASGDAGLEVRAGYFLQWMIIRWLKDQGRCRWYDLNGIASSPGVRQFKRGLGGGKVPEIPMREFQTHESYLSAAVVGAGSGLYEVRRRLKGPLAGLKRRR